MFDEIDLFHPMPWVLAIIGAGVGFFTVNGGFSGGSFQPPGGMLMKIGVLILGGAIGFIWGQKTINS